MHTHWQQKVFSKLLGLQYKIICKKGIDTKVADALFKKSSHTSHCAAVSTCTPQWVLEVVSSYSVTMDMISKLSNDPITVPHSTLQNSVLRYKNRIWIGNNPDLQTELLEACHFNALGEPFRCASNL